MDSFLISVIVPIYKAEKFLDKCVDSIVNQTYKNLEIILVDDGSPDNCPAMCDAWAKRDNRITVIHKENGGASSARNVGLDNASGDYIAFVDADDYLESDTYRVMFEDIISTNADAAGCSMVRENEGSVKEYWGNENAQLEVKSRDEILISINSTLELVCIHTGTKLYSKNVVKDIRFDESLRYCEDILFNYQVALNINKMACHLLPNYHFVYNSASATQNRVEANKFDELKVQDKIISITPEELLLYSYRGEVLKSINKLKEILTDNVYTNDDIKMLRKRVLSHKRDVFKSGLYSKATKLKVIFLAAFPHMFVLLYKLYGLKQKSRYIKKYTQN